MRMQTVLLLAGCCFSTDSAIYSVKIKLKVIIYRCKLRFRSILPCIWLDSANFNSLPGISFTSYGP